MNVDRGPGGIGYFTTLDVITGDLRLYGEKAQMFVLHIRNEGGTIVHHIIAGTNNVVASQYADKINGASAVQANTPSLSGSVGFTNGFGIFGSAPYFVVFDVADQTGASMFFMAAIEQYDGGVSHPTVAPFFISQDVNGVTRFRLALYFRKESDGANFPINTTNLPTGSNIYVRVMAFLK